MTTKLNLFVLCTFVFFSTLLLSTNNSSALPANFQDTVVFSDLDSPTAISFAPNGKVFIAEKAGIIKVYDNLQDTTPTVFADLRSQVHNYSDRGIGGMVVDPQFPARPFVYVLYTMDGPIGSSLPNNNDQCAIPDFCLAGSRLSKLTASADGNTMLSQQILIESWCQIENSHTADGLAFGADGALYLTHGDGASFNYVDYGQDGGCVDPVNEGGALRSQDLRTSGDPVSFDGAMLRVNPDTGEAFAGNPLAGGAIADDDRIISYGYRNPFRFTIDPLTGAIWVADVGWNEWEEINYIPNPTASVSNFGWPCYEGPARQGGYDAANIPICENLYTAGTAQSPYYSYAHNGGSKAVSAIGLYRGSNFPSAYDGALFFGDYTQGWIRVMAPGTNGLPDTNNITDFIPSGAYPVDIKIGSNGALYYVDVVEGTVHQISYFTVNTPPTAKATSNTDAGALPLTVHFSGSESIDPDVGDTLSYAWDLDGDGAFDDSTAVAPSFTYTQAQTVPVKLRVTDNHNASNVATITIFAGNRPPVPVISIPTVATNYSVSEVISFSGSANDPDVGNLPPSALSWELLLHHCALNDPDECHEHSIQTFPGVYSGSIPAPDHEYPSRLEFRLTATDPSNSALKRTTNVLIEPRTTTWTFTSQPPGLQLAAYGSTATTPFTRTVIVNAQSTISAPLLQQLGPNAYQFASWSDSGAQTHTVTASSVPQTFHAVYTQTAAPSIWHSWEVSPQGSGSAGVAVSSTNVSAPVEFYESADNFGIVKGTIFSSYTSGAHQEAFNNVELFWSHIPGPDAYPYAGKSTVGRGSGAGEGDSPAPTGVRDLQLHPPQTDHSTVAAFKIPQDGLYVISDIGLRRVEELGETVRLRVFNPQGTELTQLIASDNQQWVTSPSTYTISNATAGQYIYFAVDRDGDYAWDAAEISWTVTGILANQPPVPTCTLSTNPTSILQGASTSVAWTTNNATAFSINHGIGAQSPVGSGSLSQSPTTTTTYTGTATGPGGTGTCTATITVTAPPQPSCNLSLTPTTIASGASSTMAWTTLNSTSFSVNQGIGTLTPVAGGSRSVSATATTTYTGTATGAGGTGTCLVTLNVAPRPTCTLNSNPTSITQGNSTSLSWTTLNGTSFSLNQGIGTVTPVASGSRSASPTATTTYTGTVTGAGGTGTCSTTVNVSAAPASGCTLTATPSSITAGGSSSLGWTTTNATSISLNQGIGTVLPVGSGVRTVTPASTTTYLATTAGAGGPGNCSATVTVNPVSVPLQWNSWDVTTQAGSPQGIVTSTAGGVTANIEFYESTNNNGITKSSLFNVFTSGAHEDAFNNLEKFWSKVTGPDAYPYAGKSLVNRGSDVSEGNSPSPAGVRDLQLHPSNNLHNVIAAFRIPQNGTYVISGIGARRVSNSGNNSRLRIYNPSGTQLATINATNNQDWVTTSSSYTISNATAGQYIYFAVDRNGDYAWDATEITWTIRKN